MQGLAGGRRVHLGFCTNVFPGETLETCLTGLRRHLPVIRRDLTGDRPFSPGLWFSAATAAELDANPAAFHDLQAWLQTEKLDVVTLNGFPYGGFHGARVKQAVYRPDWLEEDRLTYTLQLAGLLARLLPAGETLGTISTVPLGWPARIGRGDHPLLLSRLQQLVEGLAELENRTGKRIAVALEPEPFCFFEDIGAITSWYDQVIPSGDGAGLWQRYLGLCLDCCHSATVMESPDEVMAALHRSAMPLLKVQISSCLVADAGRPGLRAELEPFCEERYLHQTFLRRPDGEIRRWEDLPDYLDDPLAGRDGDLRVHFHLPVFMESFGALAGSTVHLWPLLRRLVAETGVTHFEVETYTWSVLPPAFAGEGVAAQIAREVRRAAAVMELETGSP